MPLSGRRPNEFDSAAAFDFLFGHVGQLLAAEVEALSERPRVPEGHRVELPAQLDCVAAARKVKSLARVSRQGGRHPLHVHSRPERVLVAQDLAVQLLSYVKFLFRSLKVVIIIGFAALFSFEQ